MKIDHLIENRVKELKEHFSNPEDGWDLTVSGVIRSIMDELEESGDFQGYLTEIIEKNVGVTRTIDQYGVEVFRKK